MLDAAFGSGGQSHLDLGTSEIAVGVLALSDGKVGFVGHASMDPGSSVRDLFVGRLNADGSLDPTFGRNGITIADFGSTEHPSQVSAGGLIAQADGKLVAVGTAFFGIEPAIAVARVDPMGPGSLGVVGFRETSVGVDEGTASAVLTVRRTGGSVGAIDVDVSFANDSALAPDDYTDTSVVLSWADGDMTDRTITIPITDDTAAEDFETFRVMLSNSSTAGLALAATEAIVSIFDTDAAPPPSQGGGGGGIGPLGLELLAVLGFGLLRRTRRLARVLSAT
jgi:Calx-beta domain/Domain of unknown function (DUF5122) beta-propeller